MFLRVHDVSTSAWCWLEASVDQYCLFLRVHDVSTGAWSWLEASVDPPQLTFAAVCSTAFLTMLVSSVQDNWVIGNIHLLVLPVWCSSIGDFYH